jgi:transcriptional antiterminator Rof (Rho-off)
MVQDHADEFNRVVVQPFVQHIILHLEELIIDTSSELPNRGINVQFSGENNGLISFNNEGTTTISNISISNTDMVEVNKQIELILDLVSKEVSTDQDKARLVELLKDIKDELLDSRPREKNILKLIDRMTLLSNTITASVVLSNHLISFVDFIKRFIEAH